MTNYDEVKALFDKLEIPYTEGEDEGLKYILIRVVNPYDAEDEQKHVDGHIGSFLEVNFTKKGKFINIGVWGT